MLLSEVCTMVEYEYKDLFYKRNTDKQLKIATDDGLFTAINSDIKWENFELEESLCSNFDLRFGSCEAGMVKFQILNAFIPLSGKWMTITETIGKNTDTPFQYGRYKVFSDTPTADKEYRDIVAYDAMCDILNADVSEWYNTILPNKDSKKTLKQFRESFIQNFKLSEIVPKNGLVNDNMTVERTIEPEELSGKDVITAICEINGCFGHIGRDGKFHYIYLPQDIQGLYPADFLYPDHVPEQWDYMSQAETGHLYPQDPKGERMGKGRYIKCKYEDYVVRQINKLQIRKEENDIGTVYPKTEPSEKDNLYIIQDNFLVYGKSTNELNAIAENIYKKIRGIIYRPFDAECPGNPCFEVGDPIRFSTKYAIVESYILSRTLKGIQGLRDTYSSKGLEKRSQNVNSVQKSIVQLKGKANVLTRTIEETKLEMYDIENGLKNNISVTAEGLQANITAEKNRAEGEEEKLSNKITVTAEGLTTKITSETERASGEETKLSNSIKVTADGLSAEITRSKDAESALSTRITANAEGITTKVSKGNVSSEISQESEKVSIRSNRLVIESSQFSLDGSGNATFGGTLSGANGNFRGEVTATSGTFDNVIIHDNCTVAGKSITGTIGNNVGWNGATIQNAYIGDLNADKLKSGNVSRPVYFDEDCYFTSDGFSAKSKTNNIGNAYTGQLLPNIPHVGGLEGTDIGRSDATGKYANIYAENFYGTVISPSSEELKEEISKVSTEECLGVVLFSEVNSYKYKKDKEIESGEEEKRIEEEKNEYENGLVLPETKIQSEKIKEYKKRIDVLKKRKEEIPEIRYGFIAEKSPWQITSKNKKSVDIYSCIAMAYGAIQELSIKIERLENEIKEMKENEQGIPED